MGLIKDGIKEMTKVAATLNEPSYGYGKKKTREIFENPRMIGAIIAVMLLIGGVIAAAALSARGSSDELAGNDGTKVADSRIGADSLTPENTTKSTTKSTTKTTTNKKTELPIDVIKIGG